MSHRQDASASEGVAVRSSLRRDRNALSQNARSDDFNEADLSSLTGLAEKAKSAQLQYLRFWLESEHEYSGLLEPQEAGICPTRKFSQIDLVMKLCPVPSITIDLAPNACHDRINEHRLFARTLQLEFQCVLPRRHVRYCQPSNN